MTELVLEFYLMGTRIVTLVIVVLCALTRSLAVGPYIVTDLGDLPGGDNNSIALGINSWGQVTGYSSAELPHAILWTPTSPNAPTGTLMDLGVLPGHYDSAGLGVNSHGQVVGCSCAFSVEPQAFLWTPTTPNGTTGSMVDIGELPGGHNYAIAQGINSHGQVAGVSIADTGFRAFLWTPVSPNGTTGSMVDLGDLPGGMDRSMGSAINEYGQVAGSGRTLEDLPHAFLWTPTTPNGQNGTMIDLGDLPGGPDVSDVEGINSFGQVVGRSSNRAYLWTPSSPNGTSGSMVDLGALPGHSVSGADGINSQGVVVGSSQGTGQQRATLWIPAAANTSTGVMLDLNSLVKPLSGATWTLRSAYAVNDSGQIVGSGTFDPDGPGDAPAVDHAFLLTPVPEPSTIILIALAVIQSAYTKRFRLRYAPLDRVYRLNSKSHDVSHRPGSAIANMRCIVPT